MKIICTTSDRYKHILPAFIYLFNKYIGTSYEVVILGYDKPVYPLPDNFIFHSMGEQGSVNEWSTDIIKWIEEDDSDWYWWMMEDTFVRSFDEGLFLTACAMMQSNVGRIGLTKDIINREHTVLPLGLIAANISARYRLSTQPSLWNRNFLLQYLTPNLDPWAFEKQDCSDSNWQVIAFSEPCLLHNEGVRKSNIHSFDLNGLPKEDIDYIKTLGND